MSKKRQQTAKAPRIGKNGLLNFLTPQPRLHRQALSYQGQKNENTALNRILRHPIYLWTERIAFLGFLVYCIAVNDFQLWLIGMSLSFLLLLRGEIKFLWWYLKVKVFQRHFYADRRYHYERGQLLLRFMSVYGNAHRHRYEYETGHVIWAISKRAADRVHERIKNERPSEKLK